MANTLKYAGLPFFAGGVDWNTVYECPVGKTAIVKSVIAANDGSSASTVSAKIGVRRAGVVTRLTGSIALTTAVSVNLLAGTLALEAGDELVASTDQNESRWKKGTAVPAGTINRFEVNGSTVIGLTDTGIYRTTDMETWTQVDPGDHSSSLVAYIGTSWFVYTSATTASISTDDGLTWAAQVVTNAPLRPAHKMGGGIVKNGSTYAGIVDAQTSMTTSVDGITWTLSTAFPATSQGLIWTGTNYVTFSSSANTAYYSTTGAAWTTVTVTGVSGNVPVGSVAANTLGTLIACGSSGSISRSTNHGATWASASTGGPGTYSSGFVFWTGSVFCVQSADSTSQISQSGLAYTWGSTARSYSMYVASSFIYQGDMYVASGTQIRGSDGLLLPATAGMAITASLMEVL